METGWGELANEFAACFISYRLRAALAVAQMVRGLKRTTVWRLICVKRETGIEPATFSLGMWRSIENKEHGVHPISFWR
jgi:hypothetical protein